MPLIESATSLVVGDLLDGRGPFVVPWYQRAYAWENKEVGAFVDDLLRLTSIRMTHPSRGDEHFFGGLLTVQTPEIGGGHRQAVVDGQQRLATFVVALAVMAGLFDELAARAKEAGDRAAKRRGEAEARKTREMYAAVSPGRGKLALSEPDDPIFRHLLDEGPVDPPARESHHNLNRAWNQIKSGLTEFLGESSASISQRINNLLALRQSLLHGCRVVHIVGGDHAAAYQLFRIVNSRGKRVSDGDLLRSFSLELLTQFPDPQRTVARHWDAVLRRKPGEIDRFLRAYYSSYEERRPPQDELFDPFRKAFFDYSPPVTDRGQVTAIERRAARLEAESDALFKISRGWWPYDAAAASDWERGRLGRLVSALRHTLCFPLLLSATACLPEAKFAVLVHTLERFVFRYITVVGAHPQPLEDVYLAQAARIRAEGEAYQLSALEAALRPILSSSSNETRFRQELEQNFKYIETPAAKTYIKYFLATLEDYIRWIDNGFGGPRRPDMTMYVDLKKVDIEHIYPQNPNQRDQVLEPIKHNIGNLAIWRKSDNQSAGNLLFDDKKDRYDGASFSLTRRLGSLPSWDATELARRQRLLINAAVKVFDI
jgi:hypothetical protein